jgi:3-dehydroquinate dehydratase
MMPKTLNKKELMKMTKAKLVGYVVATVREITRDRNWQKNKKMEYQRLYAQMIKEDKEGYVLKEDYDKLRQINDSQAKVIISHHDKVHALKAALKEVL